MVRHAPTSSSRARVFPGDEPLDAEAWMAATRLAQMLPWACDAFCSPALRCRETASAAQLDPGLEPALLECDFGSWSGQTLADVSEADPDAARRWMTDPDARPHGGESLTAFSLRVARWLDEQASLDGVAVAITHAGVIKAAIVHVLAAPTAAFWRIDVSPLTVTELHGGHGIWTLARVCCAAPASGGWE